MRSFGVLLAVGVAMAGCLTSNFRPTSPDPTVALDSDRHDWGTIPATESVEHAFLVRNTGAAPLNITRVQTSCGCTAAVLDRQYLKPGEATRLKVTFDPRGRHGSQTRTVWIHSNDPKYPQKQIVISANLPEGASSGASVSAVPTSAPRTDTQMGEAPARKETVRKPPRLVLEPVLTTDRPGNALEAEGAGTIACVIRNDGTGAADQVALTIHHTPEGTWLTHEERFDVGTIAAGRDAKVTVPLTVGRDAPGSSVRFRLEVTEGNGFDAQPVELPASARAFRPPDLRTRLGRVFDAISKEKGTFGNGNGKLEPGETAELTFNVENAGTGPARGVVLTVASRDRYVTISAVQGEEQDKVRLGDIPSRGKVAVPIAVTIAPRFVGGVNLPLDLNFTDERPGLAWILASDVPVAKSQAQTRILEASPGSAMVADQGQERSGLTLAVADLEPSNVSLSDAVGVSDQLTTNLVALGSLKVVERSRVHRAMSEQSIQQTGCTEQNCAVRLGKMLDAKRIIVGTLLKTSEFYQLSVNVVSVDTGQIVFSDTVRGATLSKMYQAITELAARIGSNLQ